MNHPTNRCASCLHFTRKQGKPFCSYLERKTSPFRWAHKAGCRGKYEQSLEKLYRKVIKISARIIKLRSKRIGVKL